jgi:hypothetical protein
MKTINFATIKNEKDCLVTVGHVGYYCDSYIIVADGILLANKKPDNSDMIILTRLDRSGVILTEFNSETTWAEFEELKEATEAEMEEYIKKGGCSCGDPNCVGTGDEEGGDGVENPHFKTEFDPSDMNYV